MIRPSSTDGHRPEFRKLFVKALSLLRRLAWSTNGWQRREGEGRFTVHQTCVMHHLVSYGDATPSDLAAWMHITRGSVTPTVKRLEKLGLVKRRADNQDPRKQWLTATSEALEIAPEVEATILLPVFGEFRSWKEAELRSFVQGMERCLPVQPLVVVVHDASVRIAGPRPSCRIGSP
jgi:DNA-binding MarR family transcriptional regulator